MQTAHFTTSPTKDTVPARTSQGAAPRAPPQPDPRAGLGPAAAMTAAVLSCLRPAATIRLTSAASCGRRAPGDVPASHRVSPGRTHTFFLAPFLPPLVRRLFLPTAMVPPRRGKGKAGSSREIIRERCSRENFRLSGLARMGPHLRRGCALERNRRGQFVPSNRLSVGCGRPCPAVPHGLGSRPAFQAGCSRAAVVGACEVPQRASLKLRLCIQREKGELWKSARCWESVGELG